MSHLYVQTREESAALLKRVIAELGQHDAPFNPTSFAVWYEHFAGINPRLSMALEQLRAQQPRLSAQAMETLFRAHVAEPDAEATHVAREHFERVMSAVAEQAEVTGRDASTYGSQLEGLQRALSADASPAQELGTQLHQVADGTQRMRTAMSDLQQAVSEGRSEIARLREALDRSRMEAITDPLSQLLNRKGFDDALQRVLAAPAPAGRAHCLVMLDIDHFKRINDSHGHLVGDTVIQMVGHVLQRVSKGPGLFAGRVGGEEFAILMAGGSTQTAVELSQQVQNLVRAAKVRRLGSQETIAAVTLSGGVAAYGKGDDAKTLWAAADAALYRAKAAGRDCVIVA
jgi:diguanylate cyclase